ACHARRLVAAARRGARRRALAVGEAVRALPWRVDRSHLALLRAARAVDRDAARARFRAAPARSLGPRARGRCVGAGDPRTRAPLHPADGGHGLLAPRLEGRGRLDRSRRGVPRRSGGPPPARLRTHAADRSRFARLARAAGPLGLALEHRAGEQPALPAALAGRAAGDRDDPGLGRLAQRGRHLRHTAVPRLCARLRDRGPAGELLLGLRDRADDGSRLRVRAARHRVAVPLCGTGSENLTICGAKSLAPAQGWLNGGSEASFAKTGLTCVGVEYRHMVAPRILLVVGGGIAAYKACELVRLIRKGGGDVTCVLTDGGAQFVTAMSLAALSGNQVHTSLWDLKNEVEIGHIELSRSADLVVVCPATADLMAKMAAGIADDLGTTLILATDKPVLVVRAMNVTMWEPPATQRNSEWLQQAGVRVMQPDEGEMACGEFGPGRLPEPERVWLEIADMLGIDP